MVDSDGALAPTAPIAADLPFAEGGEFVERGIDRERVEIKFSPFDAV